MERSIEVQAQIRRDAEDHCRALRELKEWEEEMKRQRQQQEQRQEQEEQQQRQRQRQKDTTTNCSGGAGDHDTAKVAEQVDNQPPGGGLGRSISVGAGAVGGIRTNSNRTASTMFTPSPTSISNHESSSANPSPEEEMMTANTERRRGNDCYAAGKYDDAIKCYTACLRFDPRSAVVYSNRAMAHLKKKDWLKAEDDASMALTIDASHVKSYQRRSVARASLGKLRAALLDLSRAEAELESLGASGGGAAAIDGMQRSIATERKRVESLLRAAMKRAPKRCNVPIVLVREEEKMEEIVEELSDDAVSKAGSLDSVSISDASKVSEDWVVIGDATQQIDTSSPAKLEPRQTKKPTTWYEFETTWRSLESLEERSAYLSSVKPKWLANLYRNGMEDVEIVVDVVVAAGSLVTTMDTNQASLAKEYIQCVANTKCIDIPVMMMNDGQRKKVRDVIGKVFGDDTNDGKAAVAAKLGCSL